MRGRTPIDGFPPSPGSGEVADTSHIPLIANDRVFPPSFRPRGSASGFGVLADIAQNRSKARLQWRHFRMSLPLESYLLAPVASAAADAMVTPIVMAQFGWAYLDENLWRDVDMNRLEGKVALVSGAARGIGAETARKMAAAGASVLIGDVLADRARETAKEISDSGGRALALGLDVTAEASWAAAVAVATKAVRQARHSREQCRCFPRQGPDGRDHGGLEPPCRHQHDGCLARHKGVRRRRSPRAASRVGTVRRSSTLPRWPGSSARSSIRSTP